MRLRLALVPTLLLLSAALPAPAAEAPAWSLDQLMRALQSTRAASGHFVERKYLKMLTEPLESSGTLVYVAPDTLQKDTVLPKPEHMFVDRDRLVISPGPDGKDRTLSLADYPEIGAFVESIRGTLAGDLAGLNRFYKVRLSGTAADWQLLLEPKDGRMQKMVQWIRVGGSNGTVRRIDTQEADGDRSEMTVTPDPR